MVDELSRIESIYGSVQEYNRCMKEKEAEENDNDNEDNPFGNSDY